jgi:hypothetical protein
VSILDRPRPETGKRNQEVVQMISAWVMLADHAQAIGGKTFISGGGWNVTGPDPVPSAVVVHAKLPWHEMNENKKFVLELLDADGQAVEQETPDGLKPVRIEGGFAATPLPEMRPGSELGAMLAINVPPLQLASSSSFVWQLSINGKTKDEWRAVFYTRAALHQAA